MSAASIVLLALAAPLAAAAVRAAVRAAAHAAQAGTEPAHTVRSPSSGEAMQRTAPAATVARQAALGEVAACNARIAALQDARAAALHRHGDAVDVPIPEPQAHPSGPPEELTAWCARTNADLVAAEQALADRMASAAAAGFLGASPHGPSVASAPVAPASPGTVGLEGALTRILSRLLPDVAPGDRDAVTEAARRLTAVAGTEASTYLDDVRFRVQQANERAMSVREARDEAARLYHELADCPGQDVATTRAALAEVVAGRRALDSELRSTAAAARADADAAWDRRSAFDLVVTSLAGLGYQVEEGFETLTTDAGLVRLGRADWPDHAVQLRLQEDKGELHAALVRTSPGTGDTDEQTAQAWCDAFSVARQRLVASGVHTEVVDLTPPGDRPLPVVARRRAPRVRPVRRRERPR